MTTVPRQKEINLFSRHYPTIGPVRRSLISKFEQKTIAGDPELDDEVIYDTWNIRDQRNGIGRKEINRKDQEAECWWSNCHFDEMGHLLHPVKVNSTTNPTSGPVSDPAVTLEYAGAQYTAFATGAYSWSEGGTSWGSSLATLQATPTDVIVHKGKLYFACDTDFTRFDGTTWTDGNTIGTAQPCRYFAELNGKLWSVDNTGQLDSSIDEGVTWVTDALSGVTTGDFTSLWVARDTAGVMILYLGTKVGVFAHDELNQRWVETELVIPNHDFGAQGAERMRDGSYVPVGLQVNRYTASPPLVQQVGFDGRDGFNDGIPGDYRGNIIELTRSHNEVFALIDATSPAAQATFPGSTASPGISIYGSVQIYDNVGYSALMRMRYNRDAWRVLWTSSSTAAPARCMSISTADDNYRLWFGMDAKMYYIDLQQTTQNPLEITGFEFDSSIDGEHITPWFTGYNDVIDKLGARVAAYVARTSATVYAKVYYGTDWDDTTWTLLKNTTFTDGQIDADGLTEFTFASDAGLNFKAIRFKVVTVTGADSSSVDVQWLKLSYLKLLDARYGFTVTVDNTRNYRRSTGKTRLAAIDSAIDTKTLGNFNFHGASGKETHRVRIASREAVQIGGRYKEGIDELTLIAP